MHPHAKLVDDLGGPTAVAAYCRKRGKTKLTSNAVSMWRRDGVAHRWRNIVAAMAAAGGVKLPKGYWEVR